jgi:hypothetical protein
MLYGAQIKSIEGVFIRSEDDLAEFADTSQDACQTFAKLHSLSHYEGCAKTRAGLADQSNHLGDRFIQRDVNRVGQFINPD